MHEVTVSARSIEPFVELLGAERIESVKARAQELRSTLGTRAIWNINSTATGGGVAEMLRSLLRYSRGLGIDVRWLVIQPPSDFFRITKRLHNALHGFDGDGSSLGAAELAFYRQVMENEITTLDTLVRPGDVVICHDPQTAGLVPHLMKLGAKVVWRCHIGHERHEEQVDLAWDFLRPFLEHVPVAVFSRSAYAPTWLQGKRTVVLPPSIDPFAAKNQYLEDAAVRAILVNVGLIEGPPGFGEPCFARDDGSPGRVAREAEVVRLGRPPTWDTPLVVQVSRWDAMKDPIGVLDGFSRLLKLEETPSKAELVLAGPSIGTVADDPESADVFGALERAWRDLPQPVRRAIHLALLPMDDAEENAAIVNALQRHAAVIVQKSLHEGFGLTVTEAMWKRRPVVASAVGGIQDQIRNGVDGLLVEHPRDLGEFAELLRQVLSDKPLALRLGEAGYERVRDEYLSVTALERWAELVRQVLP